MCEIVGISQSTGYLWKSFASSVWLSLRKTNSVSWNGSLSSTHSDAFIQVWDTGNCMILVTLSYACTSSLSDALFGHLFSKMLLPPLERCHNQRTKCCFFLKLLNFLHFPDQRNLKDLFLVCRKYLYSNSVLFNSFSISWWRWKHSLYVFQCDSWAIYFYFILIYCGKNI